MWRYTACLNKKWYYYSGGYKCRTFGWLSDLIQAVPLSVESIHFYTFFFGFKLYENIYIITINFGIYHEQMYDILEKGIYF